MSDLFDFEDGAESEEEDIDEKEDVSEVDDIEEESDDIDTSEEIEEEEPSVEEEEVEVSEVASADGGYSLHDNVAIDLIKYSRSKQIKNEMQFLLMTYGYASGLMEDPSHYICTVAIGTSSSGKSNMQDKVEDIFPDDWLYQASTGSDNSITYDSEWENCKIASLDELNKPSDDLIEVLKGLHGDDEEFTRKATEDWQNEEVKTTTRKSKPYHFLYAQFDPDFELWNRLLKIPVDESRDKNEAVLDMHFDHHNIEFEGNEHNYIFDFPQGEAAIQNHIRNLPDDAWVKLPAGEQEYGWNVSEIVKPIFDIQRSETNRVAAMVSNLIRASALMNHENREKKDIHVPNEGVKENAIIAEPQDVANILSCRHVLIASTHEVDQKKMVICDALDDSGGQKGGSTLEDIADYIEDTNMPKLKKSQIEGLLEDMIDNNLVSQFERNGEEQYRFQGWQKFGEIPITPEIRELFAGTVDPVEQRPFIETLDELNDGIRKSMGDFTTTHEVSTGNSGQMQLASGTVDIDLEPHEKAIHQSLKESIDGRVFDEIDIDDVTIEEMVGSIPMGEDPGSSDLDGTLFDPDNDVWDQPGHPDTWVTSYDDAKEEVKDALDKFHYEGVMEIEVLDREDGESNTVKGNVKNV